MKTNETAKIVNAVVKALKDKNLMNLAQLVENALTPPAPKTALDLLREYQQIFTNRPRPNIPGSVGNGEYVVRMQRWRFEIQGLIRAEDNKSCTHQRAIYSTSCLCGKRTF